MICSLSKWFISNAFDTHREIPSFVQHHLKHCATCQDFVLFSEDMVEKSSHDTLSIIQETPDSLLKKTKPEAWIQKELQYKPGRRRRLVPVISTVLVISLIFVLFTFRPFQIFSPKSDKGVFQTVQTLSLSGKALQQLAVKIESPYDKEWHVLKKSIIAAADHLTSYLDFKIDQTQN